MIVGGTASHLHVSLKRGNGKGSEDAKVEGVPDLKVLETQFIAGLMDHFQAATAFTMPTFGSYERQVDGAWAVCPLSICEIHLRAGPMSVGVWKTGQNQRIKV